MKRICILFIFGLLLSFIAHANYLVKISGTETDFNSSSLVAASITIDETNTETITNSKGKFSLEVKKGYELVISYLGYEPKRISVNGNETTAVFYGTIQNQPEALQIFAKFSQFDILGTDLNGVSPRAVSASYEDVRSTKMAFFANDVQIV
jgi:hypothetical protein